MSHHRSRANSATSAEKRRRYDTFVIRLWREGEAGRWLRVDVEHVQGRTVVVHRWSCDTEDDDAPQWLLDRLHETNRSTTPEPPREESES